MAVEWIETGLTLYFSVTDGTLHLASAGTADASIRGTLPAFVRGLFGTHHGAPPGITRGGDATLARDFQRLLAGLEVDWEERLAGVAGDTLAHQAGNLARGFAAWGRYAGDHMARGLSEYLQRETRDLPHRAEVERFLRAVDTVRDDVERLAARLARAETQAGGP